jgi:hypothetical protein
MAPVANRRLISQRLHRVVAANCACESYHVLRLGLRAQAGFLHLLRGIRFATLSYIFGRRPIGRRCRHVRRPLIALGAGILLVFSAGVSRSASNSVAPPGNNQIAASRVSPCRTSQLSVDEDRSPKDQIDGGVGHAARVLAIRNRSASACMLQGIPRLTLFYYTSNRLFALETCSNCLDYLFRKQPEDQIALQPKESAYVVMGYDTNDGAGPCTAADPENLPRFSYATVTLGLYLPRDRSPLKIVIRDWRSCGRIDVTPFLSTPRPEPRSGAHVRSQSIFLAYLAA